MRQSEVMKLRSASLAAVLVLFLFGLGQEAWAQANQPWWGQVANKMAQPLRDCDALVFAIDNSGSIKAKNRLNWEREAALQVLMWFVGTNLEVQNDVPAIKAGRPNPTVTIYSFNADVAVLTLPSGPNAPTRLLDLVEVQGGRLVLKKAVTDAVNGIKDTDNLTWLSGAVDTACPSTTGRKGILFLFTDHEPTTPTRNGPFAPGRAMAAFRASINRFIRNCSTVILTALDAAGTSADAFFKEVVEEDISEHYLYISQRVSDPPAARPVTVAFTETEPGGRAAVLPDESIFVSEATTLTFHVSWKRPAGFAGAWVLLRDARDNEGESKAWFHGERLDLSEYRIVAHGTGGEPIGGVITAAEGSTTVSVPVPSAEQDSERPGWRYQVVVVEGSMDAPLSVVTSNVLEVAFPQPAADPGVDTGADTAVGQTVTGQLAEGSGRSAIRGSSSYAQRHTFEGTGGQRVRILLSSEDFDAYLYLIGPTGDVLAYNDDGGQNRDAAITHTLPVGGIYTIEVTSYGGGGTGRYTVYLTAAETCPLARGSLVVGDVDSGALTAGDCRSDARGLAYYADYYTLRGAPGQRVWVSLSSSEFDTYLYVRGTEYTLLMRDDDGGEGWNSLLKFDLPASGECVIEVTSYGENETGSYKLSVTAP